jgi:DNA polymerase-3 subunit alpha
VERVDKKGNKFARFSLDDFAGSTQLSLFSSDYLKWRHFIGEERAIYVRGMYQPRFNSEEQYEIRISYIELLSEIRSKLTKTVEIDLPVTDVNDAFVDDLLQVFQKHPGSTRTRVSLIDKTEHYRVPLVSRALRVDASNEFIAAVEEHGEVEVKLIAS